MCSERLQGLKPSLQSKSVAINCVELFGLWCSSTLRLKRSPDYSFQGLSVRHCEVCLPKVPYCLIELPLLHYIALHTSFHSCSSSYKPSRKYLRRAPTTPNCCSSHCQENLLQSPYIYGRTPCQEKTPDLIRSIIEAHPHLKL